MEGATLGSRCFVPAACSVGLLLATVGGSAHAALLSTGPKSPGTIVSDSSIGQNAWSSPANAATSNNLYAQSAMQPPSARATEDSK